MPGGKRNECVREEQEEEKKKKVHKKISKFFFSFKHSLTSFETEGSTFLCLAGGCASDIVAFGLGSSTSKEPTVPFVRTWPPFLALVLSRSSEDLGQQLQRISASDLYENPKTKNWKLK